MGKVSPLFISLSYSLFNIQYLSHIFTTTREAWIIFKAGKNQDRYFDADDLLRQVNNTIDIFEGLTKGWAQGLFLFNNAPSHHRRAPNAISARNMVKGAGIYFSKPITAAMHTLCARRFELSSAH